MSRDEGSFDAVWDGAYYLLRSGALELRFLPGSGEPLEEVCNVDAEVRLPDGSRWGATIFTIAEVERLMSRWATTGESLSGRYFWCSDGLVVREAGIPAMTEVVVGLLDSGEIRSIFRKLDNLG